jgi:hypothetical protein
MWSFRSIDLVRCSILTGHNSRRDRLRLLRSIGHSAGIRGTTPADIATVPYTARSD